MYQNILKLRENPETANAGKKWSEEEINELLTNIKTMTFEEVAIIHKRTTGSVKGKLLSIALSLIDKKMLIDEISEIVKLSKESIIDYMNKKPEKKVKPDKNNNIDVKTNNELSNLIEESVVSNILDIPVKELDTEIILNFEQESALKSFKTGKNIFLT